MHGASDLRQDASGLCGGEILSLLTLRLDLPVSLDPSWGIPLPRKFLHDAPQISLKRRRGARSGDSCRAGSVSLLLITCQIRQTPHRIRVSEGCDPVASPPVGVGAYAQ